MVIRLYTPDGVIADLIDFDPDLDPDIGKACEINIENYLKTFRKSNNCTIEKIELQSEKSLQIMYVKITDQAG